MVDGLLSDIGIVVVLPIRSSPLATGRPVLTCTGTAPVALGVDKGRGLPNTFPYVPNKFHVSARRHWSRLDIARGLGTAAG